MPRKNPSDWSPSYRKRIESYVRRNPFTATLDAARGHPKPEPYFMGHQETEKTAHALKKLEQNIELKTKLQIISKKEEASAKKRIERLKKSITKSRRKKSDTPEHEKQKEITKKHYDALVKKGILNPDRENDPIASAIFYH
ncbi:MAG TPA: hypothetical protein VLH15_04235 [Dehalococcoidales bacterium]|nr:hypothetical protein [Dehalococcoidales bacterium]